MEVSESGKPKLPQGFTPFARCGSGAFGEVWAAYDGDRKQYAIKILSKHRLADRKIPEEDAAKLYREVAPDGHPNLLRIIAKLEDGNSIFYLMELADNVSKVEGEYLPDTLARRLESGPLPAEECSAMAMKILDGLSALHRKGIVHRDVKPDNIIFVKGEPKLADIGLAAPSNISMTLAGSIGFMPPEMISAGGRGRSGEETDIYALGKTLYCMFTGKRPELFPDCGSSLTPASRWLNDAILMACDKRPGRRFKSADEFRMALESRDLSRKVLFSRIMAFSVVAVSLLLLLVWMTHLSMRRKVDAREFRKGLLKINADYRAGKNVEASDALEKLKMRYPALAAKDPTFSVISGDLKVWKDASKIFGGQRNTDVFTMAGMIQKDRPYEALRMIESAWQADENLKNLATPVSCYADVLKLNGRNKDAIKIYDLLDSCPDAKAKDFVGKGTFLSRLNTLDKETVAKGLAAAEKAIALDSTSLEAHLLKTATLYVLGRYPEALDSSKQALKVSPGDYGALKWRDTLVVKIASLDNPKLARALKAFQDSGYQIGDLVVEALNGMNLSDDVALAVKREILNDTVSSNIKTLIGMGKSGALPLPKDSSDLCSNLISSNLKFAMKQGDFNGAAQALDAIRKTWPSVAALKEFAAINDALEKLAKLPKD